MQGWGDWRGGDGVCGRASGFRLRALLFDVFFFFFFFFSVRVHVVQLTA